MGQVTMSNWAKGNEFARRVGNYLRRNGHVVEREYAVDVGLATRPRKSHCFDFGNESLLVECKYYDWTAGGNNPSAKISTLNESMLYFLAAPWSFRKMLFVAETARKGVHRPETLAEYYVRLRAHLIPRDVEVWQLSSKRLGATRVDR